LRRKDGKDMKDGKDARRSGLLAAPGISGALAAWVAGTPPFLVFVLTKPVHSL
jgi:hypothetical protein